MQLIEEITYFDPQPVACALEELGGLIWLDSAQPRHRRGRWSYLMAAPSLEWSFTAPSDERSCARQGDPWSTLRALAAAGDDSRHDAEPDLPPFRGGVAGYISYDFARYLSVADRLRSPVPRGPLVAFGRYGTLLALDHHNRRAWLISDNEGSAKAFRRALERPCKPRTRLPLEWRSTLDQEDYLARIAKVKAYIAAGDLYQANFAQAFIADLPCGFDPLATYIGLRKANPAPFAAYLAVGKRGVLSTSPERLFSLSAVGEVEAAPIKGTIRSHSDKEQDRAAREVLRTSQKDRAENTMIVDLLRNDLSRVCKPTSISVPELCALESFEGLHHLVSSVRGDLNTDKDAWDVLEACFPGGSITGTPKARAMEVIDELELSPRGLFCGAIGYVGYDGAADFNIAIRTVDVFDGQAALRVGGGITHLSNPLAEYNEMLLKSERVLALDKQDTRAVS